MDRSIVAKDVFIMGMNMGEKDGKTKCFCHYVSLQIELGRTLTYVKRTDFRLLGKISHLLLV